MLEGRLSCRAIATALCWRSLRAVMNRPGNNSFSKYGNDEDSLNTRIKRESCRQSVSYLTYPAMPASPYFAVQQKTPLYGVSS
jgi:hypothetical protein